MIVDECGHFHHQDKSNNTELDKWAQHWQRIRGLSGTRKTHQITLSSPWLKWENFSKKAIVFSKHETYLQKFISGHLSWKIRLGKLWTFFFHFLFLLSIFIFRAGEGQNCLWNEGVHYLFDTQKHLPLPIKLAFTDTHLPNLTSPHLHSC